MPRNIRFSQLSFSAKLSLSLFTLALALLTILFVLIIPKMQKEQYEYKIKQIEQTISLNTQQLKLAVDFIISDGETNREMIKSKLAFFLHKTVEEIEYLSLDKKEKYLKLKAEKLKCSLDLLDKNDTFIFNKSKNLNLGQSSYLKSLKHLNDWQVYIKKEEENFCPSLTRYIVNTKESKSHKILLSCNTQIFYDYNSSAEKKIKTYVQKSFSYTNNIHKGNTFLMWLNVDAAQDNTPLYNEKDKIKNNKYCISKLSNVQTITTGKLSAKQILNAANKEPIRHLLDKNLDKKYINKAITWVRSINNDPKRRLIFITTVYEEDLYNNIDSVFRKVLPASLFALLFALIIGFLLFRKFSKSLDILVKTSKEVRHGNLNLRSNIKGNDHIGELGHTFDLMIDSMQSSIKTLDSKVELRTKELQKSLDEKNTLLKEIHHRVKNNLAFTINLIKLQKRKIDDEHIKELLTDVQERIYIMELLHRKLYESKDLNSIPFRKYINELVQDITYAYNRDDLKLFIDVDDVFLDIEYAMPCGLIINECITNSFKHAFKEKNNCFKIKFTKKGSLCTLEVSDNGKGLPKDLNINKTKSLGLRLISSISTSQLLGEIEYKNDNGAKFIIKFKIEE